MAGEKKRSSIAAAPSHADERTLRAARPTFDDAQLLSRGDCGGGQRRSVAAGCREGFRVRGGRRLHRELVELSSLSTPVGHAVAAAS